MHDDALADDLLRFIDASPMPHQAVAEATRRLDAAGYRALDEREKFSLAPGDRVYVTRGGTTIAAFRIGRDPVAQTGFRLVGAHTDSPNLRLKPCPDVAAQGYRQLGVEIYGGVILATWLDRDLGIAGCVYVTREGRVDRELLTLRKPVLRVPNLAIHMNREVNDVGLLLNKQQHMVPVLGYADAPAVRPLLVDALREQGTTIREEDIVAWDLGLFDVAPSARGGARGEWLFAPRLDNLASCHAALVALLERKESAATCGVVLYDHEECGSQSSQGADSSFLGDMLARITRAMASDRNNDEYERAIARSLMVSADMAHAVHPNYPDKHEPGHRPLLGGGPVIKRNANQRYATDGETAAAFAALCRRADVTPQEYVVRTDLACGSTIGPITAGRLGIRTVDVGSPMLSMHSCREMAAAADVPKMIHVLVEHLA